MEFEEWLTDVVKIEALRAFVDDAAGKRAALEKLLWSQPDSLARARRSYEIECGALSHSS